ncbi:hypothetical protein PF010_g2584 [Phytophthora fragariae]|uniref:Uncharacterized protein n=2 Tax=Phytophthora fragariae TaxID=53985 RepID=A0A6G0LY71_9STRA|nr:hypothetical protein PF010_g2584 [Phytophthora fragariae]
MDIPDYFPYPDMPVETWIGAVEGILEELGDIADDGGPVFKPNQLFNAIGSKVKTPGGVRWYNNLRITVRNEDKTPELLFEQLRERFGRPDTDVRVRIRLGDRYWQPGERYHDYAGQLRRMAEGSRVGDNELMEYFLDGIDLATRNIVRLRGPRTLADAARMATENGVEEWNVARGMQMLGRQWPMLAHPEPLIAAAASAAVFASDENRNTASSYTHGQSIFGTTRAGAAPYGAGPNAPVLSNPIGVYNYWTGRYEPPPNHTYTLVLWVSSSAPVAERLGARKQETAQPGPNPEPDTRQQSNDGGGGRGNRGKRTRAFVAQSQQS